MSSSFYAWMSVYSVSILECAKHSFVVYVQSHWFSAKLKEKNNKLYKQIMQFCHIKYLKKTFVKIDSWCKWIYNCFIK